MKRKHLVVEIVLALGITTLGASQVYTTNQLKELQGTNQSQSETIEKLRQENDSLKDNNKKLEEGMDKLKEENKDVNSKYENTKKEIDGMLKKVSFNSDDVTQPSNVTEYHMRKALKGTALYKEASSFVEAEKKYGVNALFLAGIVANESSWGKSDRANYQNNLSGYAVYSRGAEGRTFDSWKESILETAKLLSNDYLKPNGKYYNGKSISEVNTLYCQADGQPDYRWSGIVGSIANDFKNKINK